jgi:excisionase family DNA binding protein
MENEQEFYKAKEVYVRLGVSPATFSRLRRRGEIPGAVALGGSVLVHKATFDKWLADRVHGVAV